ncbi:MAG: type II toxin-antitoxin system VapC family toxin [Planctomycetales bacterium]|nr:type II toxin-antitoxin system VapC family toxin [Planctomycetales bacterium]
MMRYLLDTNMCIAVMRKHPQVTQRMAAVSPDECAISSITSYELFTGIEKCSDPTKERAKVQLLLNTVHELPFDDAAAAHAANIRATLEQQGQPIGPYDVLLAGQARSCGLILVTANTREFIRVSGLQIENWYSPPAGET